MVHHPRIVYEELVALGGGLMKGKYMLQGWKNMHPEQHYIQDHVDLYEHIDDAGIPREGRDLRELVRNPIDLPGRWYLQVITQISRRNRLAKANSLARPQARSSHITCPTYLLQAQTTTSRHQNKSLMPQNILEQQKIISFKRLCRAAISRLFMEPNTLREHWPQIARWIGAQ